MKKYKILISDDDSATLIVLKKAFKIEGFSVFLAKTAQETFGAIDKIKPDCLLCDYHFPDGTAADICDALRKKEIGERVPVAILSGDGDKIINSYSFQADIFIEKNKSVNEVVAIVKGLLRRLEWERKTFLKGDLFIEAKTSSVFKNKKLVAELSEEQFKLLYILISKSPSFVSEEILAEEIFANKKVEDELAAIRALMFRLRKKMGRLEGRIKTKRNRGWKYEEPNK